MKFLLLILGVSLLPSLSTTVHAQDCNPAAMQQLTQLETSGNAFSQKVQEYKKEWPTVPEITPGKPSTQAALFCLSGGPHKAHAIHKQGGAVFDQIDAFKKSQTGACAEAAQKAMNNLDVLADDLETYIKANKKCSGGRS